MRHLFACTLCFLMACLTYVFADTPTRETVSEGPWVVLKLDDLRPTQPGRLAVWESLADYARAKNIKITIGIIAEGLDADTPEVEALRAWIRKEHAEGTVEFWHHGLTHGRWEKDGKSCKEFQHSGYDLQKRHFTRTQQLAKEQLGFTFTSFGAPFNATDADTVRVLAEDPDIRVWMYGPSDNPAGKVVLERCGPVNIEKPVHVPNYPAFVEGYEKNTDRAYFVLQGHPKSWNAEQRAEFERIVDYLIAHDARFVTATELGTILAHQSAGAKQGGR